MELLNITSPEQASEMKLFQTVAQLVYQNEPVWAPPSEMMWRQRFYQMSQVSEAFVSMLVLIEKGQPVARCMPQLVPGAVNEQGYPEGWIGFFECRAEFVEFAGVMLSFAERMLRDKGAQSTLISKSDNQMAGILTSGFHLPHIVFTNYNPPYYFDLLKSCGYLPKTKIITLYFSRDNSKPFHLALPGLRTREFNRENLDQEIKTFHTLQNIIFNGRPGYVPRTYAEDFEMIHSYLPYLEDKFIIIAENTSGTPVGLLICIPDIYQHMRGEKIDRARLLSIGVIPDYQHKGVGALLGAHLMDNLLNSPGYLTAEASWIMSHNRPPQNLARRFNALPGKEYWLLEKKLMQ